MPSVARPALALTLTAVLAGCAGMPFGPRLDAPEPAATTGAESLTRPAPRPPAGARTAATLDTPTAAQKAAALAPPPAPAGERELGRVQVALGNVTEPGFWLRSALVTAPSPGRVAAAGGASLAVDLLPGSGAPQLSLAAFRALGLGLTDLPTVTVYAR
ncbi:MAG TPA: hypothetical protein PKD10_11660 [Paracoccaceae bacterium]|nr:hypothetical protein [Paracoccaceae bacterium]